MRFRPAVVGAIVLIGVAATAAFIRQKGFEEEQAGLLARAHISPDQARATALAKYPGARITEQEIEEEDGRLIYSFDLLVNGDKAEVEIDAITGQVLPPDADDEHDDREDGR